MVRRLLRESVNCWLRESWRRLLFGWLREGVTCCSCGCALVSTPVRMWLREGFNSCSDEVARRRRLLVGCNCGRVSTRVVWF